MDVGKSIRIGLAKKGWTNGQLAELLGCNSQSQITRIKQTGQVTTETLTKLANAFGVQVSEFIKWGE